jgi:hypothetical protein
MAQAQSLIGDALSGEDTSGPRSQWLIAGGVAFVYALVTNAAGLVVDLQAGSKTIPQALAHLAGTTGFAFIAVGAVLDFVTGLAESFRAGMEYDHN